MSLNNTGDQASAPRGPAQPTPSSVKLFFISAIIFSLALGVRLFIQQDTRLEVGKVQTAVTEGYKHTGRLLRQEGIGGFFSSVSPLSDPGTLGHPPGYPALLALIFALRGDSNASIQAVQIVCDALAAVLVLLLAAELLTVRVAAIAGVLVALAPQFSWNSVLLLPDTLSVLPILIAVYLVVRARRRPRLIAFVTAGAFVGLSCWLRANALLLAPFLVLLVPLLFARGRRLRDALGLVAGAALVIAPLTVRNAIVFGRFIPLSLGAGQTLLEGIADYDAAGRFGIPATDLGITRREAEINHRPDYYPALFNPDGVVRERRRMAEGFAIIRAHPFWFTGVMVRRAASMLRLERARLVSPLPAVTHPLDATGGAEPVWVQAPGEFLESGALISTRAQAVVAPDGQTIRLTGDESRYGRQLASAPVTIQGNMDYVFNFPARIEQGRMMVSVAGVGNDAVYASAMIETEEGKAPHEQPLKTIQLPFVSVGGEQVRLLLSNSASNPARPVVNVGAVELFALGPASHLWLRYPRVLLRGAQRLFLTAVMLPAYFCGIVLLLRARRGRALAALLVVPAYYFCVQSALHTEYRYVLAVHYFLFIVAAATLCWLGASLWQLSGRLYGRLLAKPR
ncbi:MAG: glycosyltransferase family 39 protein [Pyrinomonadaceae bacterium]